MELETQTMLSAFLAIIYELQGDSPIVNGKEGKGRTEQEEWQE